MFPETPAARDRFILDRRPRRRGHDPWRAQGIHVEEERTSNGECVNVATIFLTGRECPWHCTMCDLWQHTTEADAPPGAIAAQVAGAVASLGTASGVRQLKLYNAGSFFDPRAVPPGDHAALAVSVQPFDRVIVESHPALVGPRTDEWKATLHRASGRAGPPRLEVAMGLETAHPAALERLNKRMTTDDFRRAADRLAASDVDLRVFLLVSPPFVAAGVQDAWLVRSVDMAVSCGAGVVSLIPMRSGNGTVEQLEADGQFVPPRLVDLERAQTVALAAAGAAGPRVFADLWDLDRLATCRHCLAARRTRLAAINRSQRPAPVVACAHCDGMSAT